jgi:hypothetical protein
MNPRGFPDANALLTHLTQADAQGKYLYRGQTHRYPPYRLPGADGTLQDVEALYPNDLRFIRELDATAPDAPAKLTAARKMGRDRRDKFMLFLKKGVLEGRAELVWLKDILAAEKAAQIEYMQWLLPQPGAEFADGSVAHPPSALQTARGGSSGDVAARPWHRVEATHDHLVAGAALRVGDGAGGRDG